MTGVLVDRLGATVIVPAVAFLLVTAGVPLLTAADRRRLDTRGSTISEVGHGQ